MKKHLVSALVGTCFAFPLCAATLPLGDVNTEALTLDRAIAMTLQKNPDLHQYAFVREQLLGDRYASARDPAYRLGIEIGNLAISGDDAPFERLETTVALSSVIELGGKRAARMDLSNRTLDLATLHNQIKTLDILGEVSIAYIQALATQAAIELTQEALTLRQAILTTVRERAQRGAASDIEVLRADAARTRSRISLNKLQHRFAREQITLARHWGDTQFAYAHLQGDLFDFGPADSFASLSARAKQSPAITALASDARLKDAAIRLAETQNRTDIDWQLGLSRYEDSDDFGLTISLEAPLGTAQRNRGQLQAARASRNALTQQQHANQLALHAQLFAAYSQRAQAIEAVEALRTRVIPSMEHALKLTRTAYEQGRLQYQDWLIAQEELVQVKAQLIDNAKTALISQTLIEQLTAEPLSLTDQAR
ncbi:MAG TPA: transporter [Gammaproteobacteria bacterium]|nr:transporter [Gammaproteobacteria bacterium]